MEQTMKSDKLRKMPIGKLLMAMSLPAMLSMLVQSLYNVVDSIFVSMIKGEGEALEAVSIAYPMQLLALAFAIGLGVGVNSLIARRLGEGRKDEASNVAVTGLILTIVNVIIFAIIGLAFSKIFIEMFTKNEKVIEMGTSYLMICMTVSVGFFVEIFLTKTLQATGNMIIPMISQLLGALTNIILDPIFIFTFKLGVSGAAIATVIGQLVSMTFCIIIFIKKKHDVSLSFKNFKFKWRRVGEIYIVGAPSIVLNAIGSLTLTSMNAIIRGLHAQAITILGIYFKLQSFVFMPVFGLMQGTMPILAYNYGALEKKRFMKCFKLSLLTAILVMALGLAVFQICPELLIKLFNGKGEMVKEGARALRIISLCFIPAAIGITFTTLLQSIGHGMKSLIMSVLRQLVFILPIAYFLGNAIGIVGAWLSYPIAEILTIIIFIPLTIVVVKRDFKRKMNKID